MNKALILATMLLACSFSEASACDTAANNCRNTQDTPATVTAHDAQYVIEHVDVTSFRSSLGPRRQKGKTTFADYGFAPNEITATSAELSESNKEWEFRISILSETTAGILVCLEDHALNGGTYHTQSPLYLESQEDGSLKATTTTIERQDCPSFK